MILVQGKGVSKGVVKGKLYFYQRPDTTITKTTVEDTAAELRRLAEAQQKSIYQLEQLADKCRAEAGDESAVLFETHAMFVEDEDYVECIMEALNEEQCNAEYAVSVAGEQFAAMFAAMDDAYMQARAADIRDIARRVVRLLLGARPQEPLREGPAILVADEFLPSEVMGLNHRRLLGLISREGSGAEG